MSLSSPHCVTYKSLVISWQRQQRLIPCSQFNLSPTILFSCADNECARRLTGGQTHPQGIHPTHTSTKAPHIRETGIIYSRMGSNQTASGATPSFKAPSRGWARLSHFRPSPPNSRFVSKGRRVPEKGREVPRMKSVYSQGEHARPQPQPVSRYHARRQQQLMVKLLEQSSAGAPAKAQTHADNSKMLRRMIKKQLRRATSLEHYKSLQLAE